MCVRRLVSDEEQKKQMLSEERLKPLSRTLQISPNRRDTLVRSLINSSLRSLHAVLCFPSPLPCARAHKVDQNENASAMSHRTAAVLSTDYHPGSTDDAGRERERIAFTSAPNPQLRWETSHAIGARFDCQRVVI